MRVLHRLVDAGNSVVLIEHHLDLIKSADWLIDLGPGAGDRGGDVVAEGTPEALTAMSHSHTGHYLRDVLPTVENGRRPRGGLDVAGTDDSRSRSTRQSIHSVR